MERFEVNILGCASATPSRRHNPSCQVVNFRDKLFMVDCGEGAQGMMRRMGLKFQRMSHIFISHLHGDHLFGLPGLLSTFALHEKGGSITIHTFNEGKQVLEPFINYFCRETPFNIQYDVITPDSGVIYEDSGLTVETFPLYHRIRCAGFIFREKPLQRHFRGDMGKFYNIPHYAINGIKNGDDWVTPDGIVIPNERLTIPARKAMSYAYCSDTMYDPRVAQAVSGVDVIYHEATYDDTLASKAHDRGHSTAGEAARVALDAGASTLIIGHYSKRYNDESLLLEQARAIFPNTIAANEGMSIDINKPITI